MGPLPNHGIGKIRGYLRAADGTGFRSGAGQRVRTAARCWLVSVRPLSSCPCVSTRRTHCRASAITAAPLRPIPRLEGNQLRGHHENDRVVQSQSLGRCDDPRRLVEAPGPPQHQHRPCRRQRGPLWITHLATGRACQLPHGMPRTPASCGNASHSTGQLTRRGCASRPAAPTGPAGSTCSRPSHKERPPGHKARVPYGSPTTSANSTNTTTRF